MFVQPRRPYRAEEHATARQMRRRGVPVRRIAAALGVSQASVSVWTRDIVLTPEQHQRNRARAYAERAESWRRRNRIRRLEWQEEGRRRARAQDSSHLAGCMLYWAEGSKDRNQLRFCNSDRAMVVYFKGFLDTCFNLEPGRYALRLNVYLGNGLALEEIEQHWLSALELPQSSLRKHSINHFPTSSSGLKTNKLPYGVASLDVRKSTNLVQHIYGAIQEYAGFDEPAWVD
jgi:hypothetical protein